MHAPTAFSREFLSVKDCRQADTVVPVVTTKKV